MEIMALWHRGDQGIGVPWCIPWRGPL